MVRLKLLVLWGIIAGIVRAAKFTGFSPNLGSSNGATRVMITGGKCRSTLYRD